MLTKELIEDWAKAYDMTHQYQIIDQLKQAIELLEEVEQLKAENEKLYEKWIVLNEINEQDDKSYKNLLATTEQLRATILELKAKLAEIELEAKVIYVPYCDEYMKGFHQMGQNILSIIYRERVLTGGKGEE